MATVLPFRGMRPPPSLAARVAAPPYDVVSSEQARMLARDNPCSFLHVSKAEIDLDPAIDIHADPVYAMAAENFRRFGTDGILRQDSEPAFYLYRQTLGSHSQTGIVGLVSADEYEQGLIRKHEMTRPDKENDRVRHIQAIHAQSGPVFLTYRANADLTALAGTCSQGRPVYDFVIDQVRHEFWVIGDEAIIAGIRKSFTGIPALYVADGHHRSAAAVRYRNLCRQNNPFHTGTEAYNYFLAVMFPHDQLNILGYHRLLQDLGEYDRRSFLDALGNMVRISPCDGEVMPQKAGQFSLYMPGQWYRFAFESMHDAGDAVAALDISMLHDRLLSPLLGIHDPRTDTRIDFLGGIHGRKGLERAVDSGGYAAAIACYPVAIEQLMAIADAGKLMPPKSTWFEPKLKSGLIVHYLG